MTDTSLVIATATATLIPTFTVLFAAYMNSRKTDDLRTEVRQDLQGMRSEILNFRQELSAKFLLIHSDISTLVKITHDHDKRITRLEDAS